MADRLDYGFRCERRAASQLRARRSGGSGRRQRRRRRRLRFHPRRGAAKEAQGQEAGGHYAARKAAPGPIAGSSFERQAAVHAFRGVPQGRAAGAWEAHAA